MFSVPYHILIHDKTCIAVIFYLSILIYGAGGVQNMAIWGVETGYYGRLVIQGRGPRLETYLCAIPHLITWLNMCKGHFLPLLVSLWRWRAPKYGHLGVKTGYYGRLVMEWVKIRLIHFISSGKWTLWFCVIPSHPKNLIVYISSQCMYTTCRNRKASLWDGQREKETFGG